MAHFTILKVVMYQTEEEDYEIIMQRFSLLISGYFSDKKRNKEKNMAF